MKKADFLSTLRSLAEEYQMLPNGATILCALSGGADSMALLHALLQLQEDLGFTVCAAHFNHLLRAEESLADAKFVAEYCQQAGVRLVTESGDVAAEAKAKKRGLEETARTLRYAFLERAAAELGASRIATAHNADDNAETLLLHLVRGSGLRGLSGIAPRRGAIVRPLLTLSRQDILNYLIEHGIPHREDSSNTDLAFARNRLRHMVLPVLRDLNPRFLETVSGTLRTLRADESYLTARAVEVARQARPAKDGGFVIATRHLTQTPSAIAPRVLQHLAQQLGMPQLSAVQIQAILTLAQDPSKPSGTLQQLSGGWMAQRIYEDLLLTQDPDVLPPFPPIPLVLDGVTVWENRFWSVCCQPAPCPAESERGVFYLNPNALSGRPMLRPRKSGDMLRLPGRSNKSLKKWLIELQFPRRLREQLPVLADDRGVIAVAELGAEESRLAQPGEMAYQLSFHRR